MSEICNFSVKSQKFNKKDPKIILDIFFMIGLFIFSSFMLVYIYQNELDKHEKLTVSMEIEKIKKLAESNSMNDRIVQDNASYYENYNITG